MKKDYAKTADTLIAALGGKDNITRLFHCMTRLRFYVKDRSKINEKEILKLSRSPALTGMKIRVPGYRRKRSKRCLQGIGRQRRSYR